MTFITDISTNRRDSRG